MVLDYLALCVAAKCHLTWTIVIHSLWKNTEHKRELVLLLIIFFFILKHLGNLLNVEMFSTRILVSLNGTNCNFTNCCTFLEEVTRLVEFHKIFISLNCPYFKDFRSVMMKLKDKTWTTQKNRASFFVVLWLQICRCNLWEKRRRIGLVLLDDMSICVHYFFSNTNNPLQSKNE